MPNYDVAIGVVIEAVLACLFCSILDFVGVLKNVKIEFKVLCDEHVSNLGAMLSLDHLKLFSGRPGLSWIVGHVCRPP